MLRIVTDVRPRGIAAAPCEDRRLPRRTPPFATSSDSYEVRDGSGDERCTKRAREAATPVQCSLNPHERAESEHPSEIPRPDGEHDEHQAPAAAEAEQAVSDAKT